MSARGAKRKGSRSSSSSRVYSKRHRKRRKPKLAKNSHVCWTDDEGYKEGYVIFDDGASVQVAKQSAYPETFSADACDRFCLKETKWRDEVQPGDVVDLYFSKSWIPCKVRGTQTLPDNPSVLVVEPVFVGYCVSAPLNSLNLRKPPTQHEQMLVLQQTGFAFNDAHNADAPQRWPAYKPQGCMDLRHLGPGAQARLHESGKTHYELISHPVVPPNLKIVRTEYGNLKFVLDSELGPVDRRSKLHTPEEVYLGSLTLPYVDNEIPQGEDETVSIFLDSAKLAQNYHKMGNSHQAAKCMLNTVCGLEWRAGSKELAHALLKTVQSAHSGHGESHLCHSLSRVVWQHRYCDLSTYGTSPDLQCLSESLEHIDLAPTREHACLKNHLCIWQMYPKLWNLSRKFQYFAECYQPVEVTMNAVDANQVVFGVTAMVSGENAYGEMHHLGRVSRIMEAFTPQNNATPIAPNLFSRKSSWDSSVWDYFGGQNGEMSTACRMFNRENCAGRDSLYDTVMKTAVCEERAYDNTIQVVRWNALEGPVLIENHVENNTGYYGASDPWPAVRGGVLLEKSCVDKMHTVARLILMEKLSQFDPGCSLIVTKPTLLNEWKRTLEGVGVPCHMYHGNRRCGRETRCAMEASHVVLTTAFCFSNHRDLWFLHRMFSSGIAFDRVVLDNLMQRKNIPPAVFDAVSGFTPRSVWLVEREATSAVFGTALALLKVRPFFKRARWGTDLSGDVRTRQYTRLLLIDHMDDCKLNARKFYGYANTPSVDDLRRIRHDLVKRLFVCGEDAGRSLFVSAVRHGESEMDPVVRRMLKMLRQKQFKKWGKDVPEYMEPSVSKFAKIFSAITKIYYGMDPEISDFCKRVATGSYSMDKRSFLGWLQSKPSTVLNQHVVEDVEKLLHQKPIEASCPICMDVVGGVVDDEKQLSLDTCVAYGVCGHVLCGSCADSIQRVALENFVSNNNDYGSGDNSVNRPRCPLCRHPWDKGQPPLIASTNKQFSLVSSSNGVYAQPTFFRANKATRSPGVQTLFRTLRGIHTKAVVVCQTNGLAQRLCSLANESNTKAVVISPQRSVLSRANAMKSFRDDDNGISQLYISAKLCVGLSFAGVGDFIIADRLQMEYAVDTVYMMFSSWKERGGAPVRMHTLSAPTAASMKSSNFLSYALGADQGSDTLGETLKNLEEKHVWPGISKLNKVCAFPRLPKTRAGYKRLLHNLFELPPPHERSAEQTYIVPLNLSAVIDAQIGSVNREFVEQAWDLLPVEEEDTVDLTQDLTQDLTEDLTEDLAASEPHASEINPEWQPAHQEEDLVSHFTVVRHASV